MVPQYLKPSFSERMQAARDSHRAAGTSGGGYRMRNASQYAPVDPNGWEAFLQRVLSRAREDRHWLMETMQHELAAIVAGTHADQGDGAFLHIVEHKRPRKVSYDIPF